MLINGGLRYSESKNVSENYSRLQKFIYSSLLLATPYNSILPQFYALVFFVFVVFSESILFCNTHRNHAIV